jgi:hypothetical protein
MLALEWGLAVTARFSVIWEPTRLPFVRACPQRYTAEPTLSGRSICFVGVSEQQVAPIPAEGHLSALNDAGIANKKMVQNTRTRDLIWIEENRFRGWGCSECPWVFNPSGSPTGNSFDAMMRNFELQRDKAFTSHLCAEPTTPRGQERKKLNKPQIG